MGNIITGIPALINTVRDPRANRFLRLGYALILIAAGGAAVGYFGLYKLLGLGVGRQVYQVSGTVLSAVILVIVAVVGLSELKRASAATGERGIVRQMMHILLRTFLLFLLPCVIITALIVLWAVVAHQPGI
jgi:hypothetical protein